MLPRHRPSTEAYRNLFVIEKKNLKQEALDHIHNMLLCQQLKWGDRVSEEAIAKQIGISRTPVREALHLYCEMGVFRRLPRFGTVVRIPEIREIEELFEIRIALESYAIAEAIRHINAEELTRLETSCDRLKTLVEQLQHETVSHLREAQINELYQTDHDFHIGIIRATGNRMLLRNINDNRMLTQILGNFRITRFGPDTVTVIHNQHRSIFEAICAKDTARAVELLVEHIRESKQGMVADTQKELGTMEERNMRRAALTYS